MLAAGCDRGTWQADRALLLLQQPPQPRDGAWHPGMLQHICSEQDRVCRPQAMADSPVDSAECSGASEGGLQ